MSAAPDDLCPICRTRYRKVARNHGKPGTALRATCGFLECVKARKNATQAALYATGEIIARLVDRYRTPARWQKAIQHLREVGALQEAVQDIGPLMKEVARDVLQEERAAIADALFDYAWPKLARGITAGLPRWYKDELAKAAFAPATLADVADPRPLTDAEGDHLAAQGERL